MSVVIQAPEGVTARKAPGPGPRVHPMAWWIWATGVALATSRSSDPAATGLLLGAIVLTVALCHDRSPWAHAFPAYLALGAVIVALRVIFYVLVGIKTGGQVLIPLPIIALPEWTGIVLLGPVSLDGLFYAASGGLHLAALVLCFGAAIALTDPKRALRSLPTPLHLLGTASVIAVTLAPHLVESWNRVRRAQQLRGLRLRGARLVRATTMPVLHDALDRSLQLAASMDSRGYARVRQGRSTSARILLLVSLLAAAIGTYALLDGTMPGWLGPALLPAAAGIAIAGSVLAGRRLIHTRYRPERWGLRESAIAAAGILTAFLTIAAPEATGAFGWHIHAGLLVMQALIAAAPILVSARPR